ncbi:MAG TPA: hypothetical protein VN612_07345 [Acidobacteriaceae bacterium]|nr:hypothetical protein [Acidobacteriaceae bacterium]
MTKHRAVSRLFRFILCLAVAIASFSVTANAQPPQPGVSIPRRTAPLEHLYWYFLLYQNHLDTKAAELVSEGKDPGTLHTRMEKRLGWSDADFAPVHTSAARLASEAQQLRAQQRDIASTDIATRAAQSKALGQQRSAYIASEIAYLKTNLSPTQFTTFEAFLYELFKQPGIPGAGPAIGFQIKPSEVQK